MQLVIIADVYLRYEKRKIIHIVSTYRKLHFSPRRYEAIVWPHIDLSLNYVLEVMGRMGVYKTLCTEGETPRKKRIEVCKRSH